MSGTNRYTSHEGRYLCLASILSTEWSGKCLTLSNTSEMTKVAAVRCSDKTDIDGSISRPDLNKNVENNLPAEEIHKLISAHVPPQRRIQMGQGVNVIKMPPSHDISDLSIEAHSIIYERTYAPPPTDTLTPTLPQHRMHFGYPWRICAWKTTTTRHLSVGPWHERNATSTPT